MEHHSDQRVTLIVGAGVTGLTAAYLLARSGEKCLLAESEPEVGGLCRTYIIDDVPFDFGPHVFFDDPDPEVNQFTVDLLKDEEILSRPYRFAVQAEGRFWKFPISLMEVLKYPWRYKVDLFKTIVKRKQKSAGDERSLSAFITDKSGPLIYANLFESLIFKKTLINGRRLHRDWWLRTERDVHNQVVPFIPPLKAGRLFERILRKLTPWYNYPLKGYGRIPQILLERFHAAGGQTILNCGPISFEQSADCILRAGLNGRSLAIKNVIWTGSINTLNHLLQTEAPTLPYIDMLIACLTFHKNNDRSRPFIYTYHPQEDIIFNRIYYPSNIYGADLPSDREGLCFEMNVSDDIRKMSEAQIVEKILQGTEKLGLYPPDALRQQRLFFLKEGLPVYDLDYKKKMKEAYQRVHVLRNLYAVGRMGGHFFCLSPSAFNQGLKIARHLQNERGHGDDAEGCTTDENEEMIVS